MPPPGRGAPPPPLMDLFGSAPPPPPPQDNRKASPRRSSSNANIHVDFDSSTPFLSYELMDSLSAPTSASISSSNTKNLSDFSNYASIPVLTNASMSTSSSPASMNVKDIILSQKFAGFWEPPVLKFNESQIKSFLPKEFSNNSEAVNLFATILICTYLELAQKSSEDSWKLIVAKAKKWIAKQKKSLNAEGTDWESLCKKILQDNKLI